MKKSFFKKRALAGLLCGAAAALAVTTVAPRAAQAAGTAAGANILNVVTVTYFDASGTNSHQAAASTTVTVALKSAPLTVANQVPFPSVDSGQTTTSYIALTANANGPDTYKLTFSETASNLSAKTITSSIVPNIGASGTSVNSGDTLSLGATSIVGVGASDGTSQTLTIPGGTLNGISTTSIVVINGTSYKVSAVSAGNVASYNVSTGTKTDEQLGSITIIKDDTVSGSGVAPNLSGTLTGTIIGERKYLQFTDNGTVSSTTADGTDSFSLSTDTVSGGNAAALSASDVATFYHVSVTITKTVNNVTSGATGSGKPGDILEYTVTVTNNSTSGTASKVSIADKVPTYTTLVSGSTYPGAGAGSGTATDIFAQITDPSTSTTANVTLDPTDNDGGSTIGVGGTNGHATVAGTDITFNLGSGATSAAGGSMPAGKVYVIKYRVQIN